jgi:hypothetical protein
VKYITEFEARYAKTGLVMHQLTTTTLFGFRFSAERRLVIKRVNDEERKGQDRMERIWTCSGPDDVSSLVGQFPSENVDRDSWAFPTGYFKRQSSALETDLESR